MAVCIVCLAYDINDPDRDNLELKFHVLCLKLTAKNFLNFNVLPNVGQSIYFLREFRTFLEFSSLNALFISFEIRWWVQR